MANGQVLDADQQTAAGALFEPRSPLEALGPLRGSSSFSSPLWQTVDGVGTPPVVETPIDDIAAPTEGLASVPSPRVENVPDAAVDAVDLGSAHDLDAAGDLEPAADHAPVDDVAVHDVAVHDVADDHVAVHDEVADDEVVEPAVDFDAPTQTLHRALVTDTAELKRRSFPWPPSPRPRGASSPTVRIRVADLLARADDDVEVAFARAGNSKAAAPAPVTPSRSFNARTLVLAAFVSMVVLSAGALFAGPMGAVKIAPEAAPTSAAGGPRISGESVVLAGSPAPAYPASIERLDPARTAASAAPAAPAHDAAMSGIPGMMGTWVPVSAPGRAGTHSGGPAVTALSTAARSPESSGHVSPAAPRNVPARGADSLNGDSLSGGNLSGDSPSADSGDLRTDDATPSQDGSDLVGGLVGGLLN